MSTLRVDNIKSRTGTTVTIPSSHTLAVTGNQTVTGSLTVSGGGTFSTSGNITTTGDIGGANLVLSGNLTVNGTTTTVNSTTVTVDDKNLELGSVASPSNTTANGGGITLKSAADRTILWDSTSLNWEMTPGITVKHTAEHMLTTAGNPNNVGYDYNSGSAQVFFLQGTTGNFGFNITNIPTTEDRVYNFVFIVNPSSGSAYPNACSINGSSFTIRWPGAVAPTATSGGNEDIYTVMVARRGTDSGNTSAGWFVFGFASLNHQ
jgi:hypothetical protein